MPKVGKMKFPYTEQGIKEAASYAKNSGKPMEMEGGGMIPKYQAGGMVPNRPMMSNQPINPRFRYGFGNRMGSGPRPQMNPGMNPGMRPGMGAQRPMGPGMRPAQSNMLRNRLAKFKKGIV
tara:strand:+ start:54 stop:416 length:363 start_codon:yes stop_codon:yes gene_type:complete